MKRRNTPLAWLTGAGLLLWMATGSYVYSENCCTPVLGIEDYRGTWTVEDGDAFQLQTNYVPAFVKDDAKPIIPEVLSKDLVRIVRYVKANPIKTVTIVGLFGPDEGDGPDLGTARAEALGQAFIRAGTPPYQVLTESGRRDDLPESEDGTVILGGIELVFGCLAPFELKDRTYGLDVNVNSNFVFAHGSVEFLLPVTKELTRTAAQIGAYLNKHPDRLLTLTGYNDPEEPYELVFDNLGIARAHAIRELLVQAGAPSTQIQVEGKEDQRLAILESDLYGQFLPDAVGFTFSEMPAQRAQQLKRQADRIEIALKKRQVYRFKDFGAEAHKIVLTDELRAYLDDIILYLSVHPEAKLYCVGHSLPRLTNEESAMKGQERADYVRDFFLAHGIAPKRIHTTTASDKHPLGTSDTRYGKQINRRVDVFVSYDGQEPQLYVLPPFTEGKLPPSTPKKKEQPKPPSETTAPKDSTSTAATPDVEVEEVEANSTQDSL